MIYLKAGRVVALLFGRLLFTPIANRLLRYFSKYFPIDVRHDNGDHRREVDQKNIKNQPLHDG